MGTSLGCLTLIWSVLCTPSDLLPMFPVRERKPSVLGIEPLDEPNVTEKKDRRPRLALAALLAAAAFAALFLLPIRDWLGAFLARAHGMGPAGPALLGAVYVVATVLFVPGSILTLGAGFLFGVVVGSITVSIAATLGACAAFLLGRTLLRGLVESKVKGSPRFAAIDRAVGREGFKIVLLTRLSPVFPFNLLNYAFGLTKVRFRDYAPASWLGMIPGTVMYVYLGSAGRSLAQIAAGEVEGGLLQRVFFVLGLAVTVAVTVFVTRIARRELRREFPEEEASRV